MAPKDDKAPEAAKTDATPKDDKAPEAPKKVSPEVKALAERIFTQMCVNQRQGFQPSHHVNLAYNYAEAFLARE